MPVGCRENAEIVMRVFFSGYLVGAPNCHHIPLTRFCRYGMDATVHQGEHTQSLCRFMSPFFLR